MPSKSSKAKQATNSRSKPSPPPQTLPIQNLPTTSSPEVNKKKKKKKNKAKSTPVVSESHVELKYEEEEEEDGDDIPPLEPAPGIYRSLTGLPPELEAAHLSATASLSATVAAAARNNPTAAAHAELIAAADDLCRRMDADPQGGIATDDDYWKSLPEHIRNFAQAMYAIAQQMVQSSGGKGPTKGIPGYPPGAFPTPNMPFDQSILSRPPFNALMEQAGAPYPSTSNSPPASRVYYSEDEQDCDEEDGEEEIIPKGERVRNSSLPPQLPPPLPPSQATPRPPDKAGGVKTSGNSNSTNVSSGGGGGQPPEFAALPALAGTVPRHSPAPVSVTTNPAMSPTSRVPPPSSRAAGKQPMNYTSQPTNPNPPAATRSARAASKQPLSAANYSHNPTHHHPSPPSSNASGPHKNRQNAPANTQSAKNNKIWSTSSTEERERIKEFWLGLGEEERRNLVKVEKEAVLKKMKEQQKHSCSCAVCGRKRNAIEDELEVLYDAYYEELEQYANYQQRYVSSGGTLPPPPGPGPFPGSVELDRNGAVVGQHKLQPPSSHPNLRSKNPPVASVPNGRGPKAQVKHPESEFEDDQDEDEYEEEDEYEAEEEDEEDEDEDDGDGEGEDGDGRHPRVTSRRAGGPPSTRRRTTADAKPERDKLFSFGSSLTVTGIDNILTVADDLLKNDGQKFLEMMEQLADRRMIREDRATASIEDDSEEDEGDDDGDDDEDDEDDDEEEEEEEEEEPMTEDQKVEEGKKMFSIFAARMFEQRVLQAYREQVAQERQLQLLRELEDEDKATKEKEAKKQTQNQKKKDKKKQQRLAKEGEKAARAAEKAAEDALVKAKQQALEDEQKKKREEERAKREATRKVQEEEKQRKEEERRKRQTEEKERQAEQERKRREREEKLKQERREKEERDRRAKEEREAKERATAAARRELQEKEEREKKARDEKERAEHERLEKEKEKAEKDKEARAAQQSRKQNARPPPSPRNATASGSTQRPPQPQTTPKKILNKSASTNVVSPVPSVSRQNSQPRPIIVTNQPIPQTPSQASNPPTPGYSPGVNGTLPQQNPLVSPRVPFNPVQQFNGFVPGPAMPQQGPGPTLGPSALPRNFGAPGFDSSYPARPVGAPAVVSPGPIGPPQKANTNPPPSMLAPGSGRRQSIIADPGPIGPPRPIQPIARPTEQSGSGSASPVRRSPSPKVLGSSALATDDDEVVLTSRRTMVNGPAWGAAPVPPRSSVDLRGPWGPPPPGFPIQPPNLPRPPVGPSPWGTASPNDQWHPSNFFPHGQFVGHNPSPPPHSGN